MDGRTDEVYDEDKSSFSQLWMRSKPKGWTVRPTLYLRQNCGQRLCKWYEIEGSSKNVKNFTIFNSHIRSFPYKPQNLYITDTANRINSYHKKWLRVSTTCLIILRPLVHTKPKVQLEISFWLSVIFTMLIDKVHKLFLQILKLTHFSILCKVLSFYMKGLNTRL